VGGGFSHKFVFRPIPAVGTDYAGHLPLHRAGGEGQIREKVMHALRILSVEKASPPLLHCDEPTCELDPVRGVTSIVVTHDRAPAPTISDRVGILMARRLITLATPDEIKKAQDPRIVDFLNPTIDVNHPRFKELEKQDIS